MTPRRRGRRADTHLETLEDMRRSALKTPAAVSYAGDRSRGFLAASRLPMLLHLLLHLMLCLLMLHFADATRRDPPVIQVPSARAELNAAVVPPNYSEVLFLTEGVDANEVKADERSAGGGGGIIGGVAVSEMPYETVLRTWKGGALEEEDDEVIAARFIQARIRGRRARTRRS